MVPHRTSALEGKEPNFVAAVSKLTRFRRRQVSVSVSGTARGLVSNLCAGQRIPFASELLEQTSYNISLLLFFDGARHPLIYHFTRLSLLSGRKGYVNPGAFCETESWRECAESRGVGLGSRWREMWVWKETPVSVSHSPTRAAVGREKFVFTAA